MFDLVCADDAIEAVTNRKRKNLQFIIMNVDFGLPSFGARFFARWNGSTTCYFLCHGELKEPWSEERQMRFYLFLKLKINGLNQQGQNQQRVKDSVSGQIITVRNVG
ncbi:MAG: hypothetical protein EOO50_10120 [Flavobacterium sp.]|uniref:hypothetical protein n=1 Tax=Flavobacterium sp. TaxID=239 RepID=UPI0011FC3D67|nr:hypothetical protein [Flavobacterium sp.]RZJ66278.1 MAG: hypothetical protein EOO50_10120 [Flavobacterium sp.]